MGEASPGARSFREYPADDGHGVRELYRLNHAGQTLDFVVAKKAEYLPLRHARMTVWEAFEKLEAIVDDSDPDTRLTQIQHALQTAEAIRAAGHPPWFVVTGLVHDLGKVLCLFGEPQWAVVGDTFPVGCAFSDKVVYPDLFAANPDRLIARYQTACGIYEEGCGLDRVHLSWGHDEYLYQVVRDHLPDAGLAMVRYHSFYAAHREGAYAALMNDGDRAAFTWVRAFNPFDLYSKSQAPPDWDGLRERYRDLVHEFFPRPLDW